MQRCQSIITTPSSRFQVAWVGQTRTHGGSSQWLHSTSRGVRPYSLARVVGLRGGKYVLERLLPYPLDLVRAIGELRNVVGCVAGLDAALATLVLAALLESIAMPQRGAACAGRCGAFACARRYQRGRLSLPRRASKPRPESRRNSLRVIFMARLLTARPLLADRCGNRQQYGSETPA